MSVLIYIDSENGKVKKSAFEVAIYARVIADKQQTKEREERYQKICLI